MQKFDKDGKVRSEYKEWRRKRNKQSKLSRKINRQRSKSDGTS